MISEHNMAGLIGADVTDVDGEKVGTVAQILVDPATGRPGWAAVRMGLLRRSSFVPLDAADTVDGGLRVPYTKALVKAAPHIDRDTLSATDEENLQRHYRGDADQRRGEARDD